MRRCRFLAFGGPSVRALVDRLVHYFASYKAMPGEENRVAMRGTYSVTHAWRVVQAAVADYGELIAGSDR